MALKKHFNYGFTVLDSAIVASDTQCTLATGSAIPLGSGETCRAVIWGASYSSPFDDVNREIVDVAYGDGSTQYTLTRGVESTTARSWVSGSKIANVATAEVLNDMASLSGNNTFGGGCTFYNILATNIRQGVVALSDSATISWNWAVAQNAKITLGGNRTMAAPTNLIDGKSAKLRVIQDATGSRTITWDSVFKNMGSFILSTSPGAIDEFIFTTDGTDVWVSGFMPNVKGV